MFNISYTRLIFSISFEDDVKLGKHKESAIRGVLGHSLMDLNCILNSENRNCEQCFFNGKCIASNIFSTSLKENVYFSDNNKICPFIIRCNNIKENLEYGESIKFSLLIFGDNCVFIPQIISAFCYAGRNYGLNNNIFSVDFVTNDVGDIIFNGRYIDNKYIIIRKVSEYIEAKSQMIDDILKLKIKNPIRFKSKGKFKRDLNVEDIKNLLYRRVILLNALEGNLVNLNEINIEILNKKIRFEEYGRYSNRQKKAMIFGGISGEINIRCLDNYSKNMLIAGELIHVGKNTSFGLGDYILE